MDVTQHLIDNIPTGNLRIPRPQFAALWVHAEHLGKQPGTGDSHLAGVIDTCRWLADAPTLGPYNRKTPPDSPYRHAQTRADPETIDTEYTTAAACLGETGHHPNRYDLARGVEAMLAWCWNATGPAPLEVPSTVMG